MSHGTRSPKGIYDGSWFSILANLYDISRSDIEQREKRRQARNWRIRTGIAIGMFTALAALSGWALFSRDRAIKSQHAEAVALTAEKEARVAAQAAEAEANRQRDAAQAAARAERVAREEEARQKAVA